jgi:hypothetical protein
MGLTRFHVSGKYLLDEMKVSRVVGEHILSTSREVTYLFMTLVFFKHFMNNTRLLVE